MIYTSYLPNSIDLSEKFADFLMHDTVANMKSAFSLMGRRFIGQPRKQQVANGIAKYVREHPLDVLHKCESDTLMYIKKMVEMGKGSNIIIGEPDIFHLQIQKMELVLTYFNKKDNQTELYLLDELHDIFAPHIDEAYKKPSEVLQKDMVKYLEQMAAEKKAADDSDARMKELLCEGMMYQLFFGLDSIKNAHAQKLREKLPAEMSDQELEDFSSELDKQSEDLEKMLKDLKTTAKDCPKMTTNKDGSMSLKQLYADAEDVKQRIIGLKKMIDQTKRSKTDFEGYMKDLLSKYPDDGYSEYPPSDYEGPIEEITFKVQLDNTPIYRTFKVIDRCSMFELNMLIQFCFNWNEMHPHAFKMERNGHWEILTPHTRLSKLLLDEGEQLHFLYDTKGNKWEHTLTVEAIDDYDGKEDDYEPKCIAGFGPDPGEGAGGNAWVRRNLPYVMKNKKKYYPFSKAEINDSFHFWWLEERHWWIEDGIIKYDD